MNGKLSKRAQVRNISEDQPARYLSSYKTSGGAPTIKLLQSGTIHSTTSFDSPASKFSKTLTLSQRILPSHYHGHFFFYTATPLKQLYQTSLQVHSNKQSFPMQRTRIRFMVMELRSHVPRATKSKCLTQVRVMFRQNKNKIFQNRTAPDFFFWHVHAKSLT